MTQHITKLFDLITELKNGKEVHIDIEHTC